MIYISLAVVFYIFYCTEVVNKFAERDTNLILSQEIIKENEMNPPFITFCLTPRSKKSILEDYKLSRGVLNEPNSNDQKILISLNKTVETLFREVTYKLNRDFHLYISLWFYEDKFGWHSYEGKMKEGNDNYIEVRIKPRLSSNEIPFDPLYAYICNFLKTTDTVLSNLAFIRFLDLMFYFRVKMENINSSSKNCLHFMMECAIL